jgi:hypothetical protein
VHIFVAKNLQAVTFGNTAVQIFELAGPPLTVYGTNTYTYTSTTKTVGAGVQSCALSFSIFAGDVYLSPGSFYNAGYTATVTIRKAVGGAVLNTSTRRFRTYFVEDYFFSFNWVTSNFGGVAQPVIVTLKIDGYYPTGAPFSLVDNLSYVTMTMTSAI